MTRSRCRAAVRVARLGLAGVLTGVLTGVLASCDSGTTPRTVLPAPLEVDSPAPAYAARALAGGSLAFGGDAAQVTLVNVWATWCTSCREEFAELERLRVAHGPAGLHVVAVSVDQGGDEKVRRFAEAQGSGFPVVHDRQGRISALYGVVGLPATYLIGRDGRVRWTMTGSFLADRESLERAIAAELSTLPAAPRN